MEHLSREALEAFVMGVPAADDTVLRRHVAECPDCARRLAEEARRELVLHESAAPGVEAFERAGDRACEVHPTPGWLRPLAIAATLAVVAGVVWSLSERRLETGPPDEALMPVESVAEIQLLPGPGETMPGSDVMSPGDLCRDVSVPAAAVPGL